MRYPRTAEEVADVAEQPGSTSLVESQRIRHAMIPVHRPPGAIEESAFLEGCTRCNECIKACPHDAIIQAPERYRAAAGTPMIEADHHPCMMCADLPCISACEPNVLSHLVPITMGTAKITEHLCLAHHGTTCTVCSERCPVPEAISVTEGSPYVLEEACTGCGVCRYVCPAPENAILLMPNFSRPGARQPKIS